MLYLHNICLIFLGKERQTSIKTFKKRKSVAKRINQPRKNKSGSFLSWIIGNIHLFRNDAETRERWRKGFALFLILFCIFSLIAFVSYFYTGLADQSQTDPTQVPIADQTEIIPAETENWLGYWGALLGEFFVHKCFGAMAFLLPPFGLFWGLVLLEDDYYEYFYKSIKFVLFGIFWGCTSLYYVSESEHWGGGFGFYMCNTLYGYLGWIGTPLLLFFAFAIFATLYLNAQVHASRAFQKMNDVRKTVNTKEIVSATKAKENVLGTVKSLVNKIMKIEEVKPEVQEQLPTPKPKINRPLPNKTPTTQNPPIIANPDNPTEITLHIKNPTNNTPPTTNQPPKPETSGQLELVIDEGGDKELPIPPKPDPTLIINREILGTDNVEKVVTEKGEEFYQKIIGEEDEEHDEPLTGIDWELYDPTAELSHYDPPKIEFLKDHGGGKGREVNRAELEENKNKIVKALLDFGIEIQSIKATIGPTVTLYEIVPSAGVRISKIRNLEDDIALNLSALGIRIIAPMPGKGTIGIEIPNSNPEIVSLRSVLNTEKYEEAKLTKELPIVMGRTISNEVYILDLNKLPHLLIAGSTGQGKSVGINTIIASLLYSKHPAQVKFVMIDPKKVELNLYQPLSNHFLAVLPDQVEPTITDTKDAIAVLKSLCIEMDNRYLLLKAAKVRNLKEYNEKFVNRRLNPRKGHKYLPYIVLIIDELADMMMIAGKEVETPIARLAQLARAVGIHLVVATQRPSVNVITGIIKANFPARMSYRVISKVDSRTILDANGADQLIGRGDLLLSTGNDVIRIQNAFVDTPEVEEVVKHISKQMGYPEPYLLPEAPADDNKKDTEELDASDRDAMFEEAARIVVRYQLGSASLIQRKLKLGYARAGRLIDQLEQAGIVGGHSGSKARDVLVSDEATLERMLVNLM